VTEKELARTAAHRLAIIRLAQEVTGNVSLTCRYYGVTRQAYYKWPRGCTSMNRSGFGEFPTALVAIQVVSDIAFVAWVGSLAT
jgi:transposase-like protein